MLSRVVRGFSSVGVLFYTVPLIMMIMMTIMNMKREKNSNHDEAQWQPHAVLIIIHPSPHTTLHTEISYTIIFMIMNITKSIIVITIISLHLIANELCGLGKSPYSSARIDYSPTK